MCRRWRELCKRHIIVSVDMRWVPTWKATSAASATATAMQNRNASAGGGGVGGGFRDGSFTPNPMGRCSNGGCAGDVAATVAASAGTGLGRDYDASRGSKRKRSSSEAAPSTSSRFRTSTASTRTDSARGIWVRQPAPAHVVLQTMVNRFRSLLQLNLRSCSDISDRGLQCLKGVRRTRRRACLYMMH